MKFSFKLSFIIVFCSITISIAIATVINLQDDEFGALLNIYVPPITGIITLIILAASNFFAKNILLKKTVFVFCVFINLITGVYLDIKYINYHYQNFIVSLSSVKNIADEKILKVVSDRYKEPGDVILKNLDGFPSDDCLSFSLLTTPWRNLEVSLNRSPFNLNHDKVTVRIVNTKNYPLVIRSAKFSNIKLWEIYKLNNITVDRSVFPVIVNPNDFADITVRFTGEALKERIKPFYWKSILKLQYFLVSTCRKLSYQLPFGGTCSNTKGLLILETDDKIKPDKIIYLNSIWQYYGESDWEPPLQMILTNFRLQSKVNFKNFDNGNNGDSILTSSDEVSASFFKRVDSSNPVSVMQIAAYHSCCLTNDSDTLQYYLIGNKNFSPVFYHDPQEGQTVLPECYGTTNTKWSIINPIDAFGFKIGSGYTDRTKNFKNKIGIRVWKAIDSNGLRIKNAYILASDYLGTNGTNYDYQDNVYFIKNVEIYHKHAGDLMVSK